MDNRVRRNAESISVADREMTTPAVSTLVESNSMQTPEERESHQQLTGQELAERVTSWKTKAEEQSACLEKSHNDRYAIALDVAAVDRQPAEVKAAYLETLFGKVDAPLASVYRTVGNCTLLHEKSTKAVIGCLPIHVAIQFARMEPDLQTKVLDYFRVNPELKPSKESLRKARRAGQIKQAKPAASKQQVDSDEARRLSSRNELAFITSADNEPFDEWEQSKQQKAVAWLQKAQREAVTVGLKLELAEALMQRMQSSTVMQSSSRSTRLISVTPRRVGCDASLTLYAQVQAIRPILDEVERWKRENGL
jgi:hypothetical protein